MIYGPFYRIETDREVAKSQVESKEIWGKVSRNFYQSPYPKVKAYTRWIVSKQNSLEFQESYDDLDFLVFAILPLLQTSRVALISHQNAPVPGIEICMRYDEENIAGVISETLKSLKLTPEDLIWIDSQYEREFYLNVAPLSILNSPG